MPTKVPSGGKHFFGRKKKFFPLLAAAERELARRTPPAGQGLQNSVEVEFSSRRNSDVRRFGRNVVSFYSLRAMCYNCPAEKTTGNKYHD